VPSSLPERLQLAAHLNALLRYRNACASTHARDAFERRLRGGEVGIAPPSSYKIHEYMSNRVHWNSIRIADLQTIFKKMITPMIQNWRKVAAWHQGVGVTECKSVSSLIARTV
jgi:hypothetical protein